MTVLDKSIEGLVEAVGQKLKPSGQDNKSPLKPTDGQWTFRFNYSEPKKVEVLISVNFDAPLVVTAELSSEMDKAEIENLKGWLVRVLNSMNGKQAEKKPDQ